MSSQDKRLKSVNPTNNSQPVQKPTDDKPEGIKNLRNYLGLPLNDKPTDDLREAIVRAAAFNTKHISTYDPSMKNLIINIDMLVEQMTSLLQAHQQQLLTELLEHKVEAENVYTATDVVDVIPVSVIEKYREGL